MAESRALGIIDKLITGPLWRLIEKTESILSLNPHLFDLKWQLSKFCKDASAIMNGETIFGENVVEHHRDEVFDKLFQSTTESFDLLTQQCLEVLLHGVLMVLERQCADQLPGGKYWNPSDQLLKMSKNAPTTNKISEADFSIIDLLIRTKPNLSCQAMLALIMWSKNKTIEWLNELDEDTKNQHLDDARKNFPEMKKKYKERKKALKEKKLEMVLKKQQKLKEKEVSADQKKIEAVNGLVNQGLRAWLSPEEALDNLNSIESESKRQEVILAQLAFYKHVISLKCPAKLFTKTKLVPGSTTRVNRDSSELQDSLLKVLELNRTPTDAPRLSSSMKVRGERDVAFEKGKEDLTKKMKDARMKRFTANQTKLQLPKLLNDPKLLVGKQVHHLILDIDGVENWEVGVVHKIEKDHKNKMRVQYSVSYNDDPDTYFIFPLLVDLTKGDLIIDGLE